MARKTKEELVGLRFGRLVVKKISEPIKRSDGYKQTTCFCVCDCGSEKVFLASNLTAGYTKSCGCLRNERIKEVCKKHNKYQLHENYGIGWTSNNNTVFLFDLEDYSLVKDYCWYEDNQKGIATKAKDNETVLMHRLVMECPPGKVVDHMYGDRSDNRKSKLRICSQKENSRNKTNISKNNKTGVIGVNFRKDINKYRSFITVNGKQKHLGYFADFKDAAKGRLKAESELFGEYAPQKHLYERYEIGG